MDMTLCEAAGAPEAAVPMSVAEPRVRSEWLSAAALTCMFNSETVTSMIPSVN